MRMQYTLVLPCFALNDSMGMCNERHCHIFHILLRKTPTVKRIGIFRSTPRVSTNSDSYLPYQLRFQHKGERSQRAQDRKHRCGMKLLVSVHDLHPLFALSLDTHKIIETTILKSHLTGADHDFDSSSFQLARGHFRRSATFVAGRKHLPPSSTSRRNIVKQLKIRKSKSVDLCQAEETLLEKKTYS